MPDLKTSVSKSKNLHELAQIINDSSAHVSFFAKRYIANNNYSSIVLISFVAKKALSMLLPLLKEWKFSMQDREDIKIIKQKIDGFYLKTDDDLIKKRIITKIFDFLRNFSTLIFSVRKKWEKLPDMISLYSEQQFKKSFPNNTLPKEPDEIFKKNNLYLCPETTIK